MSAKTQRFETRQYMYSDTYEVFHYKDAYLKEVALHHHDFYEIYFFLSGNVRYIIESRSYLLTPGDILLISPMELHQPMFHPEQRSYERIVLWMNRRFLDNLVAPEQAITACFDTSAPGHANLLQPDNALRQTLDFQLRQLIAETEAGDSYSALAGLTYLTQILIQINRLAARTHSTAQGALPSDSVVYRVLNYINEHYSENLTLDDLANQFFISKYHLSREFGRVVGTSVHRYLIQKRLVMAKQMMRQGMSSTEVYQHCGFGDYSNFYRAFKGEYRISPKDFLASLRQPMPDAPGKWLREPSEK